MKKLMIFTFVTITAIFFATNAFAEGSLYKAGNISLGAGYSASNYNISNTTPNGGVMLQASYFITDTWDVEGQYYTNSLSTMGVNIPETIISVNITEHTRITDSFGVFATFGYGSGSFTFPATKVSGGGLALALGVEFKFTPNLLFSAAYRSFYLNNTSVSTGKYMNDGLNIGLNWIL